MIKLSSLILTVLLMGCSASGSTFTSVSPIANGQAKLVLYRESSFLNGTAKYWVEINGTEVCRLHNGSFFMHDVQPGKITIASSNFGSFGTSRINLNVKPGETVYVKMTINGGRAMAGVLGGAIANLTSETIEENSGPVYLGTVSQQTAHSEMQSMHEDCQ